MEEALGGTEKSTVNIAAEQRAFLGYPLSYREIVTRPWTWVVEKLWEWVRGCPVACRDLDAESDGAKEWRGYWESLIANGGNQNIHFTLVQRRSVEDEPSAPPVDTQIISLLAFFCGKDLDTEMRASLEQTDRKLKSGSEGFPASPCLRVVNDEGVVMTEGIADPLRADQNKQTCLFFHCLNPHLPVIKWLINRVGIDPKTSDSAGQSCIFYLARDGHCDIIKYLIQHCSVDPNTVDTNGQTCIFYAARENRQDVVTELMKFGVDCLVKDLQKKTAINYATDPVMRQILGKARAKPKAGVNQKKRGSIKGAKCPTTDTSKRRKMSLLIRAPSTCMWHNRIRIPILFCQDTGEQLSPPTSEVLADKEECGPLFLVPLPTHLKRLEEQIPSMAIWSSGWSGLAAELEAALIKEDGEGQSMPDLIDSGQFSTAQQCAIAVCMTPFRHAWTEEIQGALKALRSADPDGWFQRPVDPIGDRCPDYLNIIKRPMDLGTIRRRLSEGRYLCIQEVLDDVTLVFSNCRAYNDDQNAAVNKSANLLAAEWDKWRTARCIATAWRQTEKALIQYTLGSKS